MRRYLLLIYHYYLYKFVVALPHKSSDDEKFDYGLIGDLSKLSSMVVSYVNNNNDIVRSEQTNQIYELAGDITRNMKSIIQVKLDVTSSPQDGHKLNSLKDDEKQLILNGIKLCNQYKRFNAWVDVFRHLTH